MRVKTRAMAAAAITSLALFAAACSGGGAETPDPGTSQQAGQAGGEIAIRGCTPQKALLPASTSETCGGNVLDAVAAKLIHYNVENAAPENDIAESIESDDNQNFTVKIKPDYKFHDGTVVKAKNFVDAWNYAAYGPNAQDASYFFGPVEGYGDLQCGTTADGELDCEGQKPKAKTLSGLKVVDDTTFTIKTTEKVSNLPVRLGYSAFSPLPDSFFSGGAKEQEKLPVGAGPFKVTSNTATEIVLEKFADYSGVNKPSVDKVIYRIYNSDAAAYTDVQANNLDVTDLIPSDRLVDDLYKTELEGRNSSRETGVFQSITFSPVDEQFKDNPELRKAISMALDRGLVTQQIFNNTRTPATSWVSPVVDGYKPDVCGEACTFDAAKAKQMFDAAGGYEGTLTLTYNADGGHKEWTEAACNSIGQSLGIECRAVGVPDFATLQNQLDARELKGLFRTGWQMDYPHIENFLAPLYGTGADSNYAEYSSKAFDDKLAEAAAADSSEQANALYQEAEAILAKDFPVMPLWTVASQLGWSENVTDVKQTPFSTVDLTAIKRK
jgi:oligopeptide transport system substrate-binding protein